MSKHQALDHIKHFSNIVGQPRYTCNKECANQVFEFIAINEQAVTMLHKPVLGALVTIQVPFKDLGKWKVSKAKMPELLPGIAAKDLLPQQVQMAKEELSKLQASLALHEVAEKYQVSHNQVAFSLHPSGIWALDAIKKAKALKLVPLGYLTKLKNPPPKEYHCIEHGGIKWQINPWKQYINWADGHKQQECLIPFWWVKSTNETFNMELGTITHGSFKVPCFQNAKPLAANEHLLYQKAEDTQEDTGAQGSQANATPVQKKRKTN